MYQLLFSATLILVHPLVKLTSVLLSLDFLLLLHLSTLQANASNVCVDPFFSSAEISDLYCKDSERKPEMEAGEQIDSF